MEGKDKDALVVEEARGIARVTMNCPDRFNALSPAMAAALRHYFKDLPGDTMCAW